MEQRLRIEVHRDELTTFSIQRHSSNPLADPEDETEQPQWHPWIILANVAYVNYIPNPLFVKFWLHFVSAMTEKT